MKDLAAQGRTILVSSHLMNEMAVTADHLIVIGRGKLIAAASTADIIARSMQQSVLVQTPDVARLTRLLTVAGGVVSVLAGDRRADQAHRRCDSYGDRRRACAADPVRPATGRLGHPY